MSQVTYNTVQHVYVGSIWSLALAHCDLFLQEALVFAVKSRKLFIGDWVNASLADFCKLRIEFGRWEHSEDNLE